MGGQYQKPTVGIITCCLTRALVGKFWPLVQGWSLEFSISHRIRESMVCEKNYEILIRTRNFIWWEIIWLGFDSFSRFHTLRSNVTNPCTVFIFCSLLQAIDVVAFKDTIVKGSKEIQRIYRKLTVSSQQTVGDKKKRKSSITSDPPKDSSSRKTANKKTKWSTILLQTSS